MKKLPALRFHISHFAKIKIFAFVLAVFLISNATAAYTPLTNTSVSNWNNIVKSLSDQTITLRNNTTVLVDENSSYSSHITSSNGGNHTFIFDSDGSSLYSFSDARVHFEGDTSLTITLSDTAIETVISTVFDEGEFSQSLMKTGASGYDYIQIPGLYYLSILFSSDVSSPTLGSLEVLPTIVLSENSIHEGQIGIVATQLPYTANSTGNRYSELRLVAKGPLSPAKPTPEPATASLSLLALAGLCARRRRK